MKPLLQHEDQLGFSPSLLFLEDKLDVAYSLVQIKLSTTAKYRLFWSCSTHWVRFTSHLFGTNGQARKYYYKRVLSIYKGITYMVWQWSIVLMPYVIIYWEI